MGSFKSIEFVNNKVIIIHYLLDEYNSHDFVKEYTYEIFKNEIIEKYRYGVNCGWTDIIEITENTITTIMPKYDEILIDNIKKFNIDKLKKLINIMESYNIYHDDFAFRNIGIDNNGDYHLIDLSSLTKDKSYKIYVQDNEIVIGENYYLRDDLKKII